MKKLGVIVGIIVLGIAFFLTLPSYFAKIKKSTCENRAEYIQVKLGEHVFSVPWNTYLFNGDKLIDTYHACYQLGDTPVEATKISLSPNTLYNKYGDNEIFKRTREGFALGVSMFLVNPNTPNEKVDSYVRFVEPELKNTNTKLSSLQKESGLYIWQLPHDRYYIASDDAFVTPNGNPVAFICSPFSGSGGKINCGTNIVWKDNIIWGFDHISETYVPPSRLKEFYYDFLNYMESSTVKNQKNSNNKTTGEQP